MREQERPGLTARLLFKTVDKLSDHSRFVEAPNPTLQRRKTTGSTIGRPKTLQFQPQSQRRTSYYDIPPLVFEHLPPRTRRLTPPPDSRQSLPCTRADEQTQSPLFKLPEELLLMIYKEVVGNRLLHIVRRQRKLGHVACNGSGDADECKENQCRGLKLPTGTYAQTGPGNDLIQLLQTCRKIYVDAVQVLYSSNIFDFDCMEGFISMSCALLPQRFDSIQSLNLDFRFSMSHCFLETTCFNDWPRWERTWRVLSSMEALQHLWLRLSWPKPALYDNEEKKYLEPLWLMTNTKTFEVSLPPLRDEEKPWDKAWTTERPFKIIRRSAV